MLSRTTILLPCHSLADFPTWLGGDEATGLLAACTLAWHPALLAASGELPTWQRADDPPDPDSVESGLFLLPEVARASLPGDWLDQLRQVAKERSLSVLVATNRAEMLEQLPALGVAGAGDLDTAIVNDFFALGFAYLHVELLTNATHHSGLIDHAALADTVISAARRAVEEKPDQAKVDLHRAFDLLQQARQHYYPVDSYFVEVLLPSEQSHAATLDRELAAPGAINLLASGAACERMPADLRATIRAARQSGNLAIVGGAYDRRPLANLSPEALRDQLINGEEAYRRAVGEPPRVFGQFDSNFAALLPQLLVQHGYAGAMLSTFDGRSTHTSPQAKTNWHGAGEVAIAALAATPCDTGEVQTAMRLAELICDGMQHDHVATILLAGWPGHRNEYLEDLRRIANFGPVLGNFVTLDDYFEESAAPQPWFRVQARAAREVASRAAHLRPESLTAATTACEEQVAATHQRLLEGLADVVCGDAGDDPATERIARQAARGDGSHATLLVNPWSFARTGVITPQDGETGAPRAAEVPQFGFASGGKIVTQPPNALAEGNRLVNEYLEVAVSPVTGGIQAVKAHNDRHNRLSQRLVLASPHGSRGGGSTSSLKMVGEGVEVASSTSLSGSLTAYGRLVVGPDDQVVARFRQTCVLPQEARYLILDVGLSEITALPAEMPTSLLASRLKWRDETATVEFGQQWQRRQEHRRLLDEVDWIEVSSGRNTVTLFPLGQSCHQRHRTHELDTLLATFNQSSAQARFAIALDCDAPPQQHLELLTEAAVAPAVDGQNAQQSAWFLHISTPNVIATHLSATETGWRMRVLETAGRPVRARISSWRPIAEGWQTDFRGDRQTELPVDDGTILVEVSAYDWLQFEVRCDRTG